jgi:Exopolysaccharide biosynthesis protein YbjH
MPIQELHYETAFLRLYRDQQMGRYELDILTPLKEASYPNIYTSKLLFKKDLEWWNLELLPKTHTLFGSASGKFKYALGLSLNINGFLVDTLYYSISLGYYFTSFLRHVHDVDRLNPSQIINVRTDIVRYYQQRGVTVDEAYLEKVSNWGKGWYTRISVGIFEPAYGGVATEWLYYPVNSNWAIGMDFALLKKRAYHGVDFTSYARKLHGFTPHCVRFLGSQYFVNYYYDWRCTSLQFKVSAGKFLADDFGFRTEISRYFPSGLRLGIWYTYTNAHDRINNAVYHDKGVFFSVPLDIFYTKSNRSRWGYGMSAWLRDVGVTACTGGHLFELINEERQ